MRNHLSLLLLAVPLSLSAQNPIVRDQFTADPTARVFDGRVYLYPSHDLVPPADYGRKDWFCMADYHVFSSDNLTDWTDHGVIVSQERVPWGNASAYAMWAPDCVSKEGRYYFYFPDAPRDGRGFAVGVATAERPEGPFTVEPEPIAGIRGIDPCVLVDADGQAYIYWSGMGIRGARLKANMKEIEGGEGEIMAGLPEGFKEGPFVFRRDGWYYLTFPWVRGDTSNGQNPTETLAYAMSRSPLGPWQFKGIIMAEHDDHCWTNHHSIVEYGGQWYLFYHHNDLSPRDDKRRSARIEKVAFRRDGTICEVKPTRRGVGVNRATERIEVDCFSSCASGVSTAYVDTTDYMLGSCVTLSPQGRWLRYDDVDFSVLDADAYIVVRVRASANCQLTIAEGISGKRMATVPVTVTSARGAFRRDQSGQWLTLAAPLEYVPKKKGSIKVAWQEGAGSVSIDWLQFKNRPRYFTPVAMGAAPSAPDGRGFIRRWRLMEPLPVDVRTNTVFTDTWLRQKFADEQARLATLKRAKWHALDSHDYNVKLFRFAEKYGRQTYGSFFWCETVIECDSDMPNVRLAAGSNGASMWWLNGEEVLLLEGDRRMVEDDGVSPRITLRKGLNTLRCALINGPGLSDLCARFIDEKGHPVTDCRVTAMPK